jgi:nucleotide-binding universal stress UspA family protein
MAEEPELVLCIPTTDGVATGTIRHSVGGNVLAHAVHPLMVIGQNGGGVPPTNEIVVTVDGKRDPTETLGTATAWALDLDATLRVVTVYQPMITDPGRPRHFSHLHGPTGDPLTYLRKVTEPLADVPLKELLLTPIPDPVSVANGLYEHLRESPAQLLVLGGHHRNGDAGAGVVRDVVQRSTTPLLVVPPT